MTSHIRSISFCYGRALKDIDQYAAETEAESNEMHHVDAESVLLLQSNLGVESKKGMLDKPVTRKVENCCFISL